MERAVALKKLGTLLGKKLGYRIDSKAPTPEERATAKLELTALLEERNKLQAQKEARYQAVLAADPEYQKLKADYLAMRKKGEELSSLVRHHKITVGTSEGMFFLVKAEGDSWEEVINKIEAERQRKELVS